MINLTKHQEKQIEVVSKIEKQIESNSLTVSTVKPVEDFINDKRLTLTSVHFPSEFLKNKILDLVKPLKEISPEFYYFPTEALHTTIKNIRVINDPPNFSDEDVDKAKKIFSDVIPNHYKFKIYFYKLLLFPNNLALIGTTDEELDNIIFDLDKKLKKSNVADDKQYVNSKYFFCNITLARFSQPISEEFRKKVKEISEKMKFEPYVVDSVSLLKTNVVLHEPKIIGTWKLKSGKLDCE